MVNAAADRQVVGYGQQVMVPAVRGEYRRVRWERFVLCESCENATAFGIDVGFGEASEFRYRGIVSKERELVLAQMVSSCSLLVMAPPNRDKGIRAPEC